MFRGISVVNLDSKGRIAIPVRHRDVLGQQIIITIDTELPCLLVYQQTQWEIIEQKIQALPSFNKVARRIQHLLIGHATDLELDDSGRLVLPKLLRDYAKLEKQAMLVGQGTKLEIWDEQVWMNHREQWLSEAGESESELPSELQSLSL